MQDTPAVFISGPRQAGKTTLARRIAGQKMRYLTLDDETVLLAAKEERKSLMFGGVIKVPIGGAIRVPSHTFSGIGLIGSALAGRRMRMVWM